MLTCWSIDLILGNVMNELPSVFEFLRDTAYVVQTMPVGAYVFREHEGCGQVGFIVTGSIRVFKEHSSGRSIKLYSIGAGDSCILSMSCALSKPIHQASAIVEQETEILIISTSSFQKLMERSNAARDYVFGLFSARLTDVMLLIEEVVFHRMDERLANILLENSARNKSDTVQTTHERLAEEAGTAREVVTRVLRDFAENNLVAISRGQIKILNRHGLSKVSRN